MAATAATDQAMPVQPAPRSERQRLVDRRAELIELTAPLPPRAFRRIALQAQLLEVTRRLLELETAPPTETPAVPEHPDEEGHELKWYQQ